MSLSPGAVFSCLRLRPDARRCPRSSGKPYVYGLDFFFCRQAEGTEFAAQREGPWKIPGTRRRAKKS
jgi:hypothetical protein